jgi:hypothetical protein
MKTRSVSPYGTSDLSSGDGEGKTSVHIIRQGITSAKSTAGSNVYPALLDYTPPSESQWVDIPDHVLEQLQINDDENEADDTNLEPSQQVDKLRGQLEKLQRANSLLLQQMHPKEPTGWITLHRVVCDDQMSANIYHDPPTWRNFGKDIFHLEGNEPISNIGLFTHKHKDKAFIVWREYACDGHFKRTGSNSVELKERTDKKPLEGTPRPSAITVSLLAHKLRQILHQISAWVTSDYWTWPKFSDDEFEPPDRLMHHEWRRVDEQSARFTAAQREIFQSFRTFITQHYEEQSAQAKANFDQGLFTIPDLEYLFIPGNVSIQGSEGFDNGYLQVSPLYTAKEKRRNDDGELEEGNVEYMFNVERWKFDGEYYKEKGTLKLSYKNKTIEAQPNPMAISHLNILPLKFVKEETLCELKKRGEMHWKCRHQAYVNVNGKDFYGDEKFVWMSFRLMSHFHD